MPDVDFDVRQPDQASVVTKRRLWAQYEYGNGDLNGVMRKLSFAGVEYEIGTRFPAASGVGAEIGRDASKATPAGAHLPVAADLVAADDGEVRTLESGGLVVWCAEGPEQGRGGPLRCPACGAFVSPGKPCHRCGTVTDERALAAVYDKTTGESACFVAGCPGAVYGRPCPHQLGALALALAEDDPSGDLEAQFLGGLSDHRSRRTVESAVTAADAAYVLIKERAPDEMAFGSREVAERARQAFGAVSDPGPTEARDEAEQGGVGAEVVGCLGEPEVPVPSNSDMPTAGHDPDFVVTEQVEGTLRMVGAGLRLGYSPNARGMMGRAFGLYGPPGTGKNALFRETAAALDLPCREIDLGRGADLQALIGEVVLEPDGRGGTRSVAKLGPLGKALVQGEVVVLNEVVHTDPDSQTLLHQIAQDGRIQLHNPEGADEVYEVHPSSVLGMTWNPKGGVQDRPTDALYSRLFSRRVGYPDPDEERKRLMGWAQGQGIPDLAEDDVDRVVALLSDARELSRRGGVDIPPSFRDGQRFLLQWKLTGDVEQGLEQLRGLASQLDDHELQWEEVATLFERHFGHLV
jgi:MoxR-like ATPase